MAQSKTQIFPEENGVLAELVEEGLLGETRTSCEGLKGGDFTIIKGSRLLRDQFTAWQQKQSQAKDPAGERLINRLTSAESINRIARESRALEKAKEGRTNPFLPRAALQRRFKLNYPTYQQFEAAGLGSRMRQIASKMGQITMRGKVTLSWLNEASDRASFWSGNERVRSLVQELGLDLFIRRFDGALYCQGKTVFVPANKLRVVVIRAINRKQVILKIEDGKLDEKEPVLVTGNGEPAHFFVTTAQRRSCRP